MTTSSTFEAGVAARINERDVGHVIGMLRDIYSRPIDAVIREYIANALDATREAAQSRLVNIHFPTETEPFFAVRDYGTGLSVENTYRAFGELGASPKREAKATGLGVGIIGSFGIGAKAGAAYDTKQFQVTVWFEGVERVYLVMVDGDDNSKMILLTENKSDEPRGIEVRVLVRRADIATFCTRGAELLQYLPPVETNITVVRVTPDYPSGSWIEDADHWTAVVAGVGYRINLEMIADVPSYVKDHGGMLMFAANEVALSPSREELKYTTSTKAAVAARFEDLRTDFVQASLKAIEEQSKNDWDRRLRSRNLPLFGLSNGWSAATVALPESAQVSSRGTAKGSVKHLAVNAETQAVVYDLSSNNRELGGHHYLFHTKDEAEVRKILATMRCDGMPIVLLSTLPAKLLTRTRRSNANLDVARANHHRKYFVYRADLHHKDRLSATQRWAEVKEREPLPDDVYYEFAWFAQLNKNSRRTPEFYQLYAKLSKLCAQFKRPVPLVYGYKGEKGVGVTIEAYIKSLVDEMYPTLLHWAIVSELQSVSRYDSCLSSWQVVIEAAVKQDPGSPVAFLQKSLTVVPDWFTSEWLVAERKEYREQAQEIRSALAKRYPFLFETRLEHRASTTTRDMMLRYINQIDTEG